MAVGRGIVGACLFGYGVSAVVAIIGDLRSLLHRDYEFRSQMDRVNQFTFRGGSV